jgi:hypothetical protein
MSIVFNKDHWVATRIKKKAWIIQTNGSVHGMQSEAATLSKELSDYTGIDEEVFSCTTGLPKHKDLKIWFGERLLWSHTEKQRLPGARELIELLADEENDPKQLWITKD